MRAVCARTSIEAHVHIHHPKFPVFSFRFARATFANERGYRVRCRAIRRTPALRACTSCHGAVTLVPFEEKKTEVPGHRLQRPCQLRLYTPLLIVARNTHSIEAWFAANLSFTLHTCPLPSVSNENRTIRRLVHSFKRNRRYDRRYRGRNLAIRVLRHVAL